jgi:hypothetical protein
MLSTYLNSPSRHGLVLELLAGSRRLTVRTGKAAAAGLG